MPAAARQTAAFPAIRKWLYFVAFLVFVMVLAGGATRLTDSGLSITEWLPLHGVWPPLTDADWAAAFDKYKGTTEFKEQNAAMTLAEFKRIYWWEYGHRLLGRFIGLAFAVPFVLFLVFRRIGAGLFVKLAAILALGAGQGALGWYMVQSGLVGRLDVSQYRLAAHLGLAALIFAALIWVAAGLGAERRRLRGWNGAVALLLVALVFAQIVAGGFVAGLDVGRGYNTWPKMDGAWIPGGLLAMEPAWRNFFENALTVQFQHRALAYAVLLIAVVHAWQSCTLASLAFLYIVLVQAALGVVTLIFAVPVAVALGHQAGAMLLLAAALWNLHRHSRAAPGLDVPKPALPAALMAA